jgi:hypothetical protein
MSLKSDSRALFVGNLVRDSDWQRTPEEQLLGSGGRRRWAGLLLFFSSPVDLHVKSKVEIQVLSRKYEHSDKSN